MDIWHSTNKAGRTAIEQDGFRHVDPPIGPSWTAKDRDHFWFGATKGDCGTASKFGHWVVVTVPDDLPEHYFGPDDGFYEGVYRLHKDYLNALPRRYETTD